MVNGNEVPKKPRGRPKGSKNSASAGRVGRPRKNGQPPQKKKRLQVDTNGGSGADGTVTGKLNFVSFFRLTEPILQTVLHLKPPLRHAVQVSLCG